MINLSNFLEKSTIFNDLKELQPIDGEGENCTKLMIQEVGDEDFQEIRCIPHKFMPCDCKNEDFLEKFKHAYPECDEKENNNYGKAYLCVHNSEKCMKAYSFVDSLDFTISCMPNEKPNECEDETWIELGKYKEETRYGYPIDDCAYVEKYFGPDALKEIIVSIE